MWISRAVVVALGASVAVVELRTSKQRSAAAARIADAPSAASVSAAHAIAALYKHSVVIDSAATATQQTVALPDGTNRLTESSEPVRVERGSGWVAIDATVTKTSDGRLAPKASALPLEFSAVGSGPLVTVTLSSGRPFTIAAPVAKLPKPVVAGASVTYPAIYLGVDLRLTATGTGMSEVLIVKTAAAAANPALASVSFGFGGASVSTDSAGDAIVGSGAGALVSPPASWWDSSRKDASADGPGGDIGPSQLSRTVTSAGETVNAGALAAKPGVHYPLYVDPSVVLGQPGWDFVQTVRTGTDTDAGQAFWLGGFDAPKAHVGFIDVAHNDFDVSPVAIIARGMWQENIPSSLWGAKITSAAFNGTVAHSSLCSATTQIDVAQTVVPISAATTRNSQPAVGPVLDSESITNAGDTCSRGPQPLGFNVTSPVATAAAAHSAQITLQLRAHVETDWTSWKKFTNLSVQVIYGNPPATPTSLRFVSPVVGCGTASAPVTVNSASTPLVLASTTADADGNNVDDRFFVNPENDTVLVWFAAPPAPPSQSASTNPPPVRPHRRSRRVQIGSTSSHPRPGW